LLGGCGEHAGDAHATLAAEALDGRSARVLYAPLRPLPRLLVLGAGLDAVPLVEMARQLGWRVTVADHRPAYLTRGDLRSADQLLQVRPAQLGDSLTVADFSAAVVMSHHLETDRAWLESLAPHGLPYVGLLGPQARGERLLSGLGPAAGRLRPGLHSPVGLPIGADSPETIALAILAEIQVALSRPAGTAAASH
jgi:xanthine/CO dehydrogenase XdhC/CoxF family maturation factor